MFDDFVRRMDDDLRAGESGPRLVLVLPMTRQIGLIMETFGANFTLKLAVRTGMNADPVTLQIESVLEVFPADFTVISKLIVAVKIFGVALEVVRGQERLGTKSADVRGCRK